MIATEMDRNFEMAEVPSVQDSVALFSGFRGRLKGVLSVRVGFHGLLAAFIALAASQGCASSVPSFDIAIMGGRVIDPETGLDAVRNVGVAGDKIEAVTAKTITGNKTIDASGLIVSPGFVDLHAHGQNITSGRMQALDGVTTALELEVGVLPVASFYEAAAAEGRPINYGASVNWGAARIATMIGLDPDQDPEFLANAYRFTRWQEDIATQEEFEKILSFVERGLNEGGIGVGFALGYAPGAGYKEYYRMSALAAEYNAPTFTHTRFLSVTEPGSSFEGITEVLSVAAATGVHAHIAHLNSISLRDIDVIASAIEKAQAQGVKVTTEAYPYGAGATSIGAVLFRGPDWRQRTGGLTAESFALDGKRLSEAEFSRLQEDAPETTIVVHFLDMDDPKDQAILDKSVLFPGGVIASDGGDWRVNGARAADDVWPLAKNAHSHPRSAGTYARFLRRYVRELSAVSLLEAIERVSFGPAQILAPHVPMMKNKGRLQKGADADIVVFDIDTVSDKATFEQPAQASVGFKYVLVNGELLVEEGVLDANVMPGRAIRR